MKWEGVCPLVPPGAICEMGVQDWAMPTLHSSLGMANDRPRCRRARLAGAGGPTHDPRPLFLPNQRQCISTQNSNTEDKNKEGR